MINELKAQKLLVDAIIANKGSAYKASHRFLVGVVDIAFKLQKYGAGYLEAKIEDWPKRHEYVVALPTPMQLKFLRERAVAGYITGMASFIRKDHDLYLAIRPVEETMARAGKIPIKEHTLLPRGSRSGTIFEVVLDFTMRMAEEMNAH